MGLGCVKKSFVLVLRAERHRHSRAGRNFSGIHSPSRL
jgi:hypothetical protein